MICALKPYANNKDQDLPAHSCSLMRIFSSCQKILNLQAVTKVVSLVKMVEGTKFPYLMLHVGHLFPNSSFPGGVSK